MSVGKKAIMGAIWTSGSNYLSQTVGIASLYVLGRLLLEREYGLAAYANSFVQFVFILSAFSFNLTITQAQEERPHLYSTAMLLNIGLAGLSLFITGLAVFVYLNISPVLAFFGVSAVRPLSGEEIAVIAVLAAVNALNLFGQLFDAILQRNLEFRKVSTISFLMNLVNPITTVVFAWLGAGVWSLVAGQLAAALLYLFGSWWFAGWRISLAYSRETARWFISLGWKFLGSRSLEVVYTELDRLVLKRVSSYDQVGLYDRAVQAARYPAKIVTPTVMTVALPVYAKMKTSSERLAHAYTMVNFFLVRVLMPFAILFFLAPEYFMTGLLGEKWISAAPVLRVLALYALVHPVVENLRIVFYSLGRPQDVVSVRIAQIVVFVPLLIGLSVWMGITGAAWALVVSIVVAAVILLVKVRRTIAYPFIRTFVVPFGLAALTAVVYLLLPLPAIHSRILGVLVHGGVIGVVYCLWEAVFERRSIRGYVTFLRDTMRAPADEPAAASAPDAPKEKE